MTHTISADEIAADLPPESMVAKTFANLSDDLGAQLEGPGRI